MHRKWAENIDLSLFLIRFYFILFLFLLHLCLNAVCCWFAQLAKKKKFFFLSLLAILNSIIHNLLNASCDRFVEECLHESDIMSLKVMPLSYCFFFLFFFPNSHYLIVLCWAEHAIDKYFKIFNSFPQLLLLFTVNGARKVSLAFNVTICEKPDRKERHTFFPFFFDKSNFYLSIKISIEEVGARTQTIAFTNRNNNNNK